MSNPQSHIHQSSIDFSSHKHTLDQHLIDQLEQNLSIRITKQIRIGYVVLGIFLGLLFGWSAFVPLSSAAISSGVVSVDGYSKQIQHLEGGIIVEIAVADGDQVSTGQALIKLDDTQIKAEYSKLQAQLTLATARKIRLEAEYADAKHISFPTTLQNIPDTLLQQAIAGQLEIFSQQRQIIADKMRNIVERKMRYQQQINDITGSLTARKRQLSIVSNEMKLTEKYVKQGLLTRNDLFTLQNREAGIASEIKDKRAQLNAIKQELSQLEFEQENILSSRKTAVNELMQTDRKLIIELKHAITKQHDKLKRTVIRAPVNGTVVNLQQHTIGGVLAPGQKILEIVPEGQKLVIDARIEPKDRDIVKSGQSAKIRFTAYSQRSSRPVEGMVKVISADRLIDVKTNIPYFLAKVEIVEDLKMLFNDISIHPGMQAEVMIITGERTALSYLITPLQRSFSRAFVED